MPARRILIVEDEPIVAINLHEQLEDLGYQPVGPAASGEAAITLAGELRPDLVLMDIQLEGDLDGIAAAREIRKRFQIPSLIVSAFSEDATLERAKLAEPLGYILKPIEGRELKANIEMALYKHRMEEDLREKEESYRTLADSGMALIWTAGTDKKCDYFNQPWLKFTGRTLEQELGDGWAEGVHPDDLARCFKIYTEAFDRRESFSMDYRLRRHDGQFRWIQDDGSLRHDSHGDFLGYIGHCLDITERKQAEEEKKRLEAQNRALQKSESLGRMAGAIAHNFNNQLQVVLGSLELAQGDLPPNAAPGTNLSRAMQYARKAADISTQMLAYLGQTHVRHEPLDLSEACRRSLPLLQAALPPAVVLETDLPAPGLVINANDSQMHQVLTQLLTNAWEASRDGVSAIHLAIKPVAAAAIPALNRFPSDWQPRDLAYACLEVADSGCGITVGDMEKIFDPFFTSKFIGRGLGLAVVLGIAREHGGGLTVESAPGRGSLFRVFLPVTAAAAPQTPVPVVPAPRSAVHGTVLVVDDEPSLRATVTRSLQLAGFQVFAAADGVAGVELFEQHRDEIQCVVCDLSMPRLDGWGTLTALRQLAPGLPVILSSGYDHAQVMAGQHPELPQAFLQKPYQFKELIKVINQVWPPARVEKREGSS